VLLRVLRLGAHRLLVSALGAHRDRRVRFELARLLAHSKLRVLVPLLERARESEATSRRREIYAWVREQIEGRSRSTRGGRQRVSTPVPVR
jgi:hypothetical protein